MQAHCPRCGARLAADATECPTCAYGDVEEIVLLEAQSPAVRPSAGDVSERQLPASLTRSAPPRILAVVAILVVVIAAIAALR